MDGTSDALNKIATNTGFANQQMGSLIQVLTSIFPFSSVVGTFTMSAAATTVVANANVTTGSKITLTATNAAAGTLVGSTKSPYISAQSAGVSFTVATASGVAAAGTETFSYLILNPAG